MKTKFVSILIFLCFFSLTSVLPAQNRPHWFVSPEVSFLGHDNHMGIALGFQAGATFLKDRLQFGFFFYGRSGPINSHTETLILEEGMSYKGQSQIQVRADHGAFGLFVAPQFRLAKGKLCLDVPLQFGQMGAGFYLTGEDRNTPDGRRVSEWENELMGGVDAGFGFMVEGGARLRMPLTEGIEGGLGLHYTRSLGWDAHVADSDYYNLPRFSLFFRFGN